MSTLAAWMVSGRGCLAAAGFAAATLAVFGLVPHLDIAAAHLFYGADHRFVGETPAGAAWRRVFAAAPFVVALAMLALYGLRRAGLGRLWAPSGRGVLFLVLSLALGPGLLVNVALKDQSHRPRPVQTDRFGGDLPFRPVGRFDGGCRRNCSFVSGEGATAFWTLAPALLVPVPWQTGGIAAALVLGVAASLLRMAFGGHYLSDTIMAALLVWLVVAATWRVVMRAR